jgi:hypothetical protein
MTNLKIGDKVKCIKPTCLLDTVKIYTILDVNYITSTVWVENDLGKASYMQYDDDIEFARFVKVKENKLVGVIPTAKVANEKAVAINTQKLTETVTKAINEAWWLLFRENGRIILRICLRD